tara:strand:- start:414 stop:650 length:237 start_codon:yes stop_codon:yes gene_type:complete
MAPNNPTQDSLNQTEARVSDFDQHNFVDLPVGELFWLSNEPNGDINVVHRKVSETEGTQLKNQVTSTFNGRLKVYQKI